VNKLVPPPGSIGFDEFVFLVHARSRIDRLESLIARSNAIRNEVLQIADLADERLAKAKARDRPARLTFIIALLFFIAQYALVALT
jgi:hypothetical protein